MKMNEDEGNNEGERNKEKEEVN